MKNLVISFAIGLAGSVLVYFGLSVFTVGLLSLADIIVRLLITLLPIGGALAIWALAIWRGWSLRRTVLITLLGTMTLSLTILFLIVVIAVANQNYGT
jgi:hypothetical protein